MSNNCHKRDGLKHIILLPTAKICCGVNIIIRNRPSFPLVYTTNGTVIAALFSGEYRKACGKKFSYSYYQVHDKMFYYSPTGKKYFHITSQTIFSIMEDFTNNIAISSTSF